MPFTSITRLRLRSWKFYPAFFVQSFRSGLQARSAEGSLSVTVLNDAQFTFWTRTTWSSAQAMRKYMLSGAHRKAMLALPHWCDEASVAHWTQESEEVPSWEEAHRQLQTQGRATPVNHPSEDQRAFRIREPKVRPFRELRLK